MSTKKKSGIIETPCRLTNRDMGLDSPAHSAQNSPRYVQQTSEEDRNPEAPAELTEHPELIQADTIGDTVFSRHWLFTTLMTLIKAVDDSSTKPESLNSSNPSKDNSNEDKSNNVNKSEVSDGNNDGEDKTPSTSEVTSDDVLDCTDGDINIDDNLQDELCKLWDMAMNAEVVKFLQEFNAVKIFTGVIAKSKAPRATEICVGILGNMACNKNAATEMAQNNELRKLALLLLGDPDVPTLIETTRLIHVCVSDDNSDNSSVWLNTVKTTDSVQTSLIFILNSSTNNELLCNCCLLLDKLMDMDDDISESFSTKELIFGLVEAAKQCGYKSREPIDTILHILQLMSTTSAGVQVLVDTSDVIHELVLLEYIFHQCSQLQADIDEYTNSLTSAVSILHVILKNTPSAETLFFKDIQLIRCCLKLLEAIYPQIEGHRSYTSYRGQRRSREMSRHERDEETTNGDNVVTEGDDYSNGADLFNSSINVGEVNNKTNNSSPNHSCTAKTDESCSSIRGPRSTRRPYANKVQTTVDTKAMNKLFYETLQAILAEILLHQSPPTYVNQETIESDCSDDSKPCHTSPVWEYLEKTCSRERLFYMIVSLNKLTLPNRTPVQTTNDDKDANSETSNNSINISTCWVDRLKEIANRCKLKRLSRFLLEEESW